MTPRCPIAPRHIILTEGAARLIIYRMRRKFRELLGEEIARTVADTADIPGQLAWFRAALAER